MDRDAKYVAVGAFVLVAIAMAAAFLIWYSDSGERREYAFYEIYFTGTVSGLTRGGPVRYLGVDIGRVRELAIDPDDPGRVKVVVEVDTTAPINSATRAGLRLQGVTGLLYVDLKQAPDATAGAPLPTGDRYPVIESAASDFDIFVSSLPELVARFNDLVSEENVAALTRTLANMQATTETLPDTATDVAALVREVRATLAEIDGAARHLRRTVGDAQPQVQALLGRFGEVAADLASVSERLDGFLAQTETRVGQFSNHGLFELEELLRESRAAAAEFRELSQSLRENPSRILYEPPDRGVEIPP